MAQHLKDRSRQLSVSSKASLVDIERPYLKMGKMRHFDGFIYELNLTPALKTGVKCNIKMSG